MAQSNASSFLGNKHNSLASPRSQVCLPLVNRRDIGRNYRQIVLLRCAHYMNATFISSTKKETTVAARIFGIVFDEFAQFNDRSDLAGGNHSLGACHLPDRMRQVQQTPAWPAPRRYRRSPRNSGTATSPSTSPLSPAGIRLPITVPTALPSSACEDSPASPDWRVTGITGLEGRTHGVKATLVEPGPMDFELGGHGRQYSGRRPHRQVRVNSSPTVPTSPDPRALCSKGSPVASIQRCRRVVADKRGGDPIDRARLAPSLRWSRRARRGCGHR